MSETMKAVLLDAFGDPEVLEDVRDVPIPRPGFQEVLVKTGVCSVCYLDVIVRSGIRPGIQLPRILGHEIAGEIVELGDGVRNLAAGDRVASTYRAVCGHCWYCRHEESVFCTNVEGIGVDRDGGYAEYVAVPSSSVSAIPDEVSDEQASIAGCVLGAVYRGVIQKGRVRAGETVLVTGAGGGAGIHAVQLAALSGARVLAVTTSPEKVRVIEEAGADEVLVGSSPEVLERLRELTRGRGVDVALDTVGHATSGLSLRALGRGGRLVFIGEVGTEPARVSVARMLYRETEIYGVASPSAGELAELLELIARGEVRPMISETLPLERAADAHVRVGDRAKIGKIALRP